MVTDSKVQVLIGYTAFITAICIYFRLLHITFIQSKKHAECCPRVHTSFDQNLLGFVLKQV